jgi:hypothetical protein
MNPISKRRLLELALIALVCAVAAPVASHAGTPSPARTESVTEPDPPKADSDAKPKGKKRQLGTPSESENETGSELPSNSGTNPDGPKTDAGDKKP